MHIETDRLWIRDLERGDLPALVELWADPEVTRFMGGPRDAAELESIFQADLDRSAPPTIDDLWPVVERSTGQVVGHCGLLEKDVDGRLEIELVYVLARSAWGRGYATEAARALRDYAFRDLGLGRIVSLIDPDNAASERVAGKSGLRFEREIVRDGGSVRRVYALNADDLTPEA